MVKEGKGNYTEHLLLVKYLHLLKVNICIHFAHKESVSEPALELGTLVICTFLIYLRVLF